MPGATDVPAVTVVVIGRNEGDRLARCLDSVHAMRYPSDRVEIIYVDSDSTDDSVRLAKCKDAIVLEVKPERPAAAIGRNAGWRAADTEFVLFLDGDTILDPDFLGRAMAEFADPAVAVVFGHRREIDTRGSLYNRDGFSKINGGRGDLKPDNSGTNNDNLATLGIDQGLAQSR